MIKHEFGGEWTTEKLSCLKEYLTQYTKILRNNERAKYFSLTYVDAFAGTGYRSASKKESTTAIPLLDLDDEDRANYLKGSARIALEIEPPFHWYLFLERKAGYTRELERLKLDYPFKASKIKVVQADANTYLKNWCETTDWKKNRAVVFLDPYGMQVEWSLIEAIAKTKAIDLWWLFPLGVSTIRMLTKDEMPPKEWSDILTRTFGTEEWKNEFYPERKVQMLWGEEDQRCRNVEFENVGNYIVKRLKTIFPGVVERPLQLCNSRNNPLYLLCFAAGNPKGAKTALNIAKYILDHSV